MEIPSSLLALASAMARRGTIAAPSVTTGLPRSALPAVLGACTSTVVA